MELSLRWARAQPRRVRRGSATRMRCSASSRAAPARRCAQPRSRRSIAIGFDGYAIGGLAVGEPAERARCACWRRSSRCMPPDRPRYLMGVGTPADIVRGRRPRHRHVRLRDADAQRPQRAPVHDRTGSMRIRNAAHQDDTAPARPGLRLLHLPPLLAAPTCATWTAATRSSARASTRSTTCTTTCGLMARIRAAIDARRVRRVRARVPAGPGGRIVSGRQPAGLSGIIAGLFADAPSAGPTGVP